MKSPIPPNEPSNYDNVPYPGYPYPATHPDLLAAIAILFGMNPPAVRSCRVLEIGCGDGSNIIPMAISLPHAEFLGIDLAAKPISRARAVIRRSLIRNVTVQVMDLLDVTSDFGKFDYIIAHGFYSWVPAPLQDKLLQVCGELLTSDGIAFISYNTFPAAYFRHAFRDIMLFHLRWAGGSDRVEQGKAVIEFIINSIEDGDKFAWKAALQDELSRVNRRDDNVIYHNELNKESLSSFSKRVIGDETEGIVKVLGCPAALPLNRFGINEMKFVGIDEIFCTTSRFTSFEELDRMK